MAESVIAHEAEMAPEVMLEVDEQQPSSRRVCLMRILNMVSLVLIAVLVCLGVKYVMDQGGLGNILGTGVRSARSFGQRGGIRIGQDILSSISEVPVPPLPSM